MGKKVLIIGDFCYPNYMGGSSKHVFDLITHMPKNGTNVTLITRKKSKNSQYSAEEKESQEVFDRIKDLGKIIELSNYNLFNIHIYWKYIRQADYVILQHPVMGVLGGIIGKLLKKKTIYHYHGPIHLEYQMKTHRKDFRYRLFWLLQKITVLTSDKVLTHSNYMRDVSISEHSVPAKKSIYLPPYIEYVNVNTDLPFFKTTDKINLLIPRRLTARTGVIEFLNAFLRIPTNIRSKFHVYISGKGELRHKVEELVHKDPDNLSYIGFLSYDELWSLYKRIDSVVVPTLDLEGFGYIILEAMSCGSSAIVSKTCGGGYEFVRQHLGEKFTFDIFSEASILEALRVVESAHSDRRYYQSIAEQFSIDSMINYYTNNILT